MPGKGDGQGGRIAATGQGGCTSEAGETGCRLHHDFARKISGFFGATNDLQALTRMVQPGGGRGLIFIKNPSVSR